MSYSLISVNLFYVLVVDYSLNILEAYISNTKICARRMKDVRWYTYVYLVGVADENYSNLENFNAFL